MLVTVGLRENAEHSECEGGVRNNLGPRSLSMEEGNSASISSGHCDDDSSLAQSPCLWLSASPQRAGTVVLTLRLSQVARPLAQDHIAQLETESGTRIPEAHKASSAVPCEAASLCRWASLLCFTQ